MPPITFLPITLPIPMRLFTMNTIIPAPIMTTSIIMVTMPIGAIIKKRNKLMLARQDDLEVKKETFPEKISIMTFNIACLPFLGAINAKFLRLNHERVKLIIEKISKWNHKSKKKTPSNAPAPDIICFQEAMAPESRSSLKKGLSEDKNALYPYNTDSLGTHLRSSGLMIFSKYPIIDSIFIAFDNEKKGDESLALKGVMGIKLQLTEQVFITVFNTHLEAGGAIASDKQKKNSGKSISFDRGEQMGLIDHLFKTWGLNPPKELPDMKHHKTFFCGDFNTPLNDERRMLSISTGNANNGFKKGMTKYPGQHELFSHVEHTVPKNFMEVRDDKTYKNFKKQIIPELLEIAKKENLFIGSAIAESVCKENKESFKTIQPYDAQPKIIDGIFCSYLTDKEQSNWNVLDAPGNYETRILSLELNGEGGPSAVGLSDHFPIQSFWTPTLFQKPGLITPSHKASSEQSSYCGIM